MIAGFFHPGSGLGNQLHRYVATRVFAESQGYEFAMCGVENFKGKDFMNLSMGVPLPYPTHIEYPAGKLVADCDLPVIGEGTHYYNPEMNFLPDNIMIDGEFQDERYFETWLSSVNDWLKVEALEVPEDVCIINFRGGEFSYFPELFLTPDYWQTAVSTMEEWGVHDFEVHTDDPRLAKEFFPDFPVVDTTEISHSFHTNMGLNWRALRFAKYAIVANSSFPILPRLLKHHETPALTIAPRYWAGRNVKEWRMPANFYKAFIYV